MSQLIIRRWQFFSEKIGDWIAEWVIYQWRYRGCIDSQWRIGSLKSLWESYGDKGQFRYRKRSTNLSLNSWTALSQEEFLYIISTMLIVMGQISPNCDLSKPIGVVSYRQTLQKTKIKKLHLSIQWPDSPLQKGFLREYEEKLIEK